MGTGEASSAEAESLAPTLVVTRASPRADVGFAIQPVPVVRTPAGACDASCPNRTHKLSHKARRFDSPARTHRYGARRIDDDKIFRRVV